MTNALQTPLSGTVLVTGASSGIGATYADRLAKKGHDLILVARNKERLTALAERLHNETGVAIEILPADLTAKADVALVERRLRKDAAIGALINNAGIAVAGPLLGADPDALERMVFLNVLAPTRLAVAAGDAFAAAGRGTIVNIASVLALAPEIFNGAYSGTKAYILNLSLALHQELAAKGGRVQAVLPGATRTEIWERAGLEVSSLPAEMIMEVGEMVDAALRGLEIGETVTIPPLAEGSDWDDLNNRRLALTPKLSTSSAGRRYKRQS